MKPKEITYKEVFYQRNVDLGIDPLCHECTSHALSSNHGYAGYPTIKRSGKQWRIHRYIYYKNTGENPEVVMHLCDNPKCINLKHLKSGTILENVRDVFHKGRRDSKEEKNSNSKLTEWDVRFIKYWIKKGYAQTEIARAFKVNYSTISCIKFKRSWRCLDEGS